MSKANTIISTQDTHARTHARTHTHTHTRKTHTQDTHTHTHTLTRTHARTRTHAHTTHTHTYHLVRDCGSVLLWRTFSFGVTPAATSSLLMLTLRLRMGPVYLNLAASSGELGGVVKVAGYTADPVLSFLAPGLGESASLGSTHTTGPT